MRKKVVAKTGNGKGIKPLTTQHQDKTLNSIRKAHKEGRSILLPKRVLSGKDKNHVYLEAEHRGTGKTHHIAIHQDGNVLDPHVLHSGKFDPKSLKEHPKPKKVTSKIKKENPPVKKPIVKKSRKLEISTPEPPKNDLRKVVAKVPVKPIKKKEEAVSTIKEDKLKPLKDEIIKQAKEELKRIKLKEETPKSKEELEKLKSTKLKRKRRKKRKKNRK